MSSQMTENQHLLAAHCDAKGKMWSNIHVSDRVTVLHQLDAVACVMRSSPAEKIAVFSKVAVPRMTALPAGRSGITGTCSAGQSLSDRPNSDKQVITEGASTVVGSNTLLNVFC
ncbi:hypothetical protein ACNKHK_18450 [Shigella flexneri]